MHASPGVRALPSTRRTLPPVGAERRGSRCASGFAHRYDPPLVTRRRTALATAALLALTPVAAGCNGDDDEKTATGPTTTTGDRAKSPPPPKEREEALREAAEAKQQQRELKDLDKDDEKIEESFEESPFERAILKLPVRRPPLYVQQYITGEGHKVYTAVDEKRFCKMSRAKRQAAVTSFYKAADRSLRRAGVKDYVQVVTPLAATTEELPALATGQAGKVSLSRRGRGC